jgi:hypothetical protein
LLARAPPVHNPRMKQLVVALALVLSFAGAAGADTPPPSKVKLLAAGKDPKPLRFAPKKGTKRTLTSTMTHSAARGLAGKITALEPQPGVKILIDLAIAEASADKFRCDYVYRKPEVLGDKSKIPAGMVDVIKAFDGIKGSFVATNRGVLVDSKISSTSNKIANESLQMMQSTMQQVVSAMPEEAVGVGAKWVTTSTVVAGELTVTMDATYELVELAGTKLKLKSSIKGKGKGKGAGNLTVDITGKAEIEVDLALAIPTRMLYQTRTEVGLDLDGKRLGQVSETSTELR